MNPLARAVSIILGIATAALPVLVSFGKLTAEQAAAIGGGIASVAAGYHALDAVHAKTGDRFVTPPPTPAPVDPDPAATDQPAS